MAYKTLFPGQEKEETVFLLIRKHWFNYLIFIALDVLMAIPIIAMALYSASNPDFLGSPLGNILIILLSAFVLIMLGAQLYGFVDYYLDVYIVTDNRIVDINQEGFFKRQISELHLHQVQDVNAKVDGFAQTLIHFGDVYIQTAGERENFVFKSIPHPYSVAKKIVTLHEKYMERARGGKKKLSPESISSEIEDTGIPFQRMPQENIQPSPKVKEKVTPDTPNPNKQPVKKQQTQEETEEGEMKEGKEIDL